MTERRIMLELSAEISAQLGTGDTAFDPACTVITSIDLDHMDYLGNSRASIGREKAGVFRRSVTALCGDPQPPETVTDYAKAIETDFRQAGFTPVFLPE